MLSDIKIWPTKGTSKIKANGEVTISEVIKVSFKVIEGSKGLFVSFPQEMYQKDGENKYKNLVDFVSPETKNDVSSKLIAAYNKRASGADAGSETPIEQPKANNKPKNSNIPF